jgi:hypothetical protein
MLKNYIIVAVRNILRHKVYSIINIAGLSVGMACTILILLWVQYELSFDRRNGPSLIGLPDLRFKESFQK